MPASRPSPGPLETDALPPSGRRVRSPPARSRTFLMHRFAALSFLAWLGMLSPAVVAAPDHPIVPGFERFYTDEKADVARGGQLLLGELNCVSCHKAADSSIVGKQAPILDFL